LEWANNLKLSQDKIKELFANYDYIQDESGKYIYSPKIEVKYEVATYDLNDSDY
jgi:hypothetical protein